MAVLDDQWLARGGNEIGPLSQLMTGPAAIQLHTIPTHRPEGLDVAMHLCRPVGHQPAGLRAIALWRRAKYQRLHVSARGHLGRLTLSRVASRLSPPTYSASRQRRKEIAGWSKQGRKLVGEVVVTDALAPEAARRAQR